ncbi:MULTISPECIES: hypothetical protein [Kosakonia]|uniref:Uncharacterized protein n=1 Tax=Kosakonia oryzae TaxID=497725 RepID=A0AA94KQE0_9ENTR|nr:MULTISPECIES: hypothetical protein [Kosakonia]ANI82423.1 hypothetical protein AWR26_09760 [Kosakonia oryzae]SFC57588.1 hypothetical protein SAMN05216286_2766 [Kosakonia oryzae]VVT52163.1 Phage protein (ACLAME 687) [Kosakonia radicincitans]
MAAYGALINVNGNPFVTPNSTPFCLYRKVVVNSVANGTYQGASASIPVNASYPAIAFCKTSNTAQPTYVSAIRSGSNVMVSSGNPYGQAHTLTAYIFAIFPQTLPEWGIAIWDAAGRLVLTNESRVLSDLVTIGTPGNNGGINIDQTLSGSYAVCPGILGATLIQVMVQGQPQVIAATAYTGCRFNGSTSRISAASSSNASGSVVGSTNNGNAIIAIKTDPYD